MGCRLTWQETSLRTYRIRIKSVIALRCVRTGPPPTGKRWRECRVQLPGITLEPSVARGLADAAAEKLAKGHPYTVRINGADFTITIRD